MTKTGKKHKRGARGSTDEEATTPKRANMADAHAASAFDTEETGLSNEPGPSLEEIREILVNIQTTVSNILTQNNQMGTDIAELKNTVLQQKSEIIKLKETLAKTTKRYEETERELAAARDHIEEQKEEIAELYQLQDSLEQYTRKNSLEVHGVPESAYTSTEEVVLKLAEALQVSVQPDDIEISHKLFRKKGNKPIIVKFVSHKVKANLYRARTKLKNFKVSDLFTNASSATRVEAERIFLNENLTPYRKQIINRANEKRKDGELLSVWSMDGTIFVKTSPEGRPIKIRELEDLENL